MLSDPNLAPHLVDFSGATVLELMLVNAAPTAKMSILKDEAFGPPRPRFVVLGQARLNGS
jgi:hypothetical protein